MATFSIAIARTPAIIMTAGVMRPVMVVTMAFDAMV
jgi:hypothetical protein